VLDLGHPDAYAYILERLDALLSVEIDAEAARRARLDLDPGVAGAQLVETSVPGAMRLPGLDPARCYRVQLQPPGGLAAHMRGIRPPPWTVEGITLPGSALGAVGLCIPALFPEQLLLIRVHAVAP
jgi:hypothetical protein